MRKPSQFWNFIDDMILSVLFNTCTRLVLADDRASASMIGVNTRPARGCGLLKIRQSSCLWTAPATRQNIFDWLHLQRLSRWQTAHMFNWLRCCPSPPLVTTGAGRDVRKVLARASVGSMLMVRFNLRPFAGLHLSRALDSTVKKTLD